MSVLIHPLEDTVEPDSRFSTNDFIKIPLERVTRSHSLQPCSQGSSDCICTILKWYCLFKPSRLRLSVPLENVISEQLKSARLKFSSHSCEYRKGFILCLIILWAFWGYCDTFLPWSKPPPFPSCHWPPNVHFQSWHLCLAWLESLMGSLSSSALPFNHLSLGGPAGVMTTNQYQKQIDVRGE